MNDRERGGGVNVPEKEEKSEREAGDLKAETWKVDIQI